MSHSLVEAFLRQNPMFEGVIEPDTAELYAEHHAGGLVVLGSYAAGGDVYVKLHETWGPGMPDEPGDIVVHAYDPNFSFTGEGEDEADPTERIWHFTDAREALNHFLGLLAD